jgi:hypothetical protein
MRTVGSMAAMGCGLPSAVPAGAFGAVSPPRHLDECGAATFAAHLRSRFRVTDASGRRADVELTHVHELACDPSLEQFSLVFEDDPGAAPLGGACQFDHPALGRQTLFITAHVAADSERPIYEAPFNRRRAMRDPS